MTSTIRYCPPEPFVPQLPRGRTPLTAGELDAFLLSLLSPLSIDPAHLESWLRPDPALVTLSSGKISGVADQSGTGDSNKNLVGPSSYRPNLLTSDPAYNNQPTIAFDGTMYLASPDWLASLNQPFTVYLVGHAANVASQQTLLDNVEGDLIIYADASKHVAVYSGSPVLSSSTGVTSPSVICCVFNGSSSAIYINDATTAKASGSAGAHSLTSILLGANEAKDNFLTGTIADCAAYSGSHNHATRSRFMHDYAGTRYAITVTP